MKFDISGNPAYGDLTVALAPGESSWYEGGALSRMSGHIELKTRLVSGFLKSAVRKLAGGESLFISECTAPRMAFVSLTPSCSGTVLHRQMNGDRFYLTSGPFLACTPGMELHAKFGDLRARRLMIDWSRARAPGPCKAVGGPSGWFAALSGHKLCIWKLVTRLRLPCRQANEP